MRLRYRCVRQLSAAGVLAAVVWAPAPSFAQNVLEAIRSEGSIGVGVANERPYGYVDDSGQLTGEAPEIARHVLQEIAPGVEMQPQVMPFGQLIDAVREEEIDVVAAGMFITPQRCAQVAFSEPTYVVGEAFAVKAGNPLGIVDYHSISNDRRAKVGLISGTVEYNYALVTGIPADRALLYRSFDRAIRALKEGEVDAVGLTALTAKGIVKDEPGLEATRQFFPVIDGEEVKGYGAFAFRKDDTALLAAFNRVLEDFIGTDAHWQLVERFGFGPDMAPDKTAEELCTGT
ncbi:MAG: ectoine/hydroxyectoine ABC transporter substrate-binding protein EhuB [Rhodovibrionaceae bacterium]|nr:ectoine/hydroxyectoine ABC transporter substrate-binding protein EhuB [Rhodovibrionaceae bacterium]